MSDFKELTELQEKHGGYFYLASPYSDPDTKVQDMRAHDANDIAGVLLQNGVYVHQPIWSTHRISLEYELPGDHLFWLGFNKAFIDPSVGMIMCDIPGWKESKGCQQEIEYARSLGKPIWLLNLHSGLTAL